MANSLAEDIFMETKSFEAAVDFYRTERGKVYEASLVFEEEIVPASFFFYERESTDPGMAFVFVSTSRNVPIKWGENFQVQSPGTKKVIGRGKVLNPSAQKPSLGAIKKRSSFLEQLMGDDLGMLDSIVREKGIRGLGENEALAFAPLSSKSLLELSQRLESRGQIRILSFSPLFLLSQESFEFLCQEILAFLSRYHRTHPDLLGAPLVEVRKKFDLPPRIFSLALKHLDREKKIIEVENRLALFDFKVSLSPEEEELLERMEEMYLQGKLQSVSMEELQSRFNLSIRRLENLLSLLTKRRKIVQGQDGFVVHSQWLDELVGRIRDLGKKELSVSEFKEMTGLSRKYAIPLLELLDQMGVTRRKGPIREIL